MEWYWIVILGIIGALFLILLGLVIVLLIEMIVEDWDWDWFKRKKIKKLNRDYIFLESRYNKLKEDYIELKEEKWSSKEGSTDWLYIGGNDLTETKNRLKEIIKGIDEKINNALIYDIVEHGADIIEFFINGKSIGRFTKQGAIDYAKKNLKLKAENFKAEPNSNPSYAFEYGFTTILPLIHTYYEVEKKAKA